MAITIQATPADYSSVQDDLIYTVAETVHTADPTTYPNYKFVGDVYVGATQVARIKKVPDPITKIGIFNIGQIVRNYLATTFNPDPIDVLAQRMGNGEFSVNVTMKFGEEYGFTLFTNLTVDDERTFYNNYNGRLIGTTTSLSADRVLSDRSLVNPIKCNSAFNFIPYLPSTTAHLTVTFKVYNYSNAMTADFNFGITPVANELLIINASREAINANEPGAITDGSKYYTVEFNSNDIQYQFNLDCECMYEVSTLHFFNKYGGFESKDFTKLSRKTIAIEKKDFGKLPYTVDDDGNVSYKSANNVYNESRSTYSSLYKEKMTLNSDLLTDQDYVWLQQLIVSPMVFIEESGYFYPVVITESNYEQKKFVNDDLTNLTINIEFGEQQNAQFR